MTDGSHPAPPTHLLEAALYADDLDAAEAFYRRVLGLPVVVKVPGRHVFFRCGSGVLLVFDPEATARPSGNPEFPVPPHGAHGPSHVCLAVDGAALDDWRGYLERAGVEIEADFRWPSGARSVYFRDPAGNSIEIAEPHLWA